MNFRATARPLGFLMWVLAASLLFPLVLAIFEDSYGFKTTTGFATTLLITALVGLALWLVGRNVEQRLHRKEGMFIVSASWIMAGLLGGLPFYVSGAIPGLLDCAFESISGFTTTGSSILTDIEAMPQSILLWRSLTHWLGGMGIVVLFVAILPSLGIGGKHLYRIEATGPAVTGLHPRAVDTARSLWLIYSGMSLLEFLLLWAGGMSAFDAVCHTFGTMATGGFSTMNASVGHYSTYFHVVITVFMFLCGVNFSLYYQALRGKLLFWKDAEFRLYVLIAGVAVVVLLACQMLATAQAFPTALRDSFFVGTSILTTTGFGTADFEKWPYFAQGFLVVLMLVGGCAGSTGGGMKVVRVLITLRWAWKNAIHSFKPHSVMPLRVGGVPIDREIEEQVVGFVLLFMLWLVAGVLVLLACGHDLVTSFTASVASVANIGPGLGLVGPTDNYSFIHPVGKAFLCVLMLVGRLEVMAITALLIPSFWKK